MVFSGIPIWLAVSVASAAAAILLALHFLHRKYSPVVVPTLLFWQSVVERSRHNRLGGKFRRLLTFLLLTAIVLLMAFAAIRPSLIFAGRTAKKYVVIADCRASMGIVDAGKKLNRLNLAAQMCGRWVKSLADADKIMFIRVADKAEVIGGIGDSRAASIYAIDSMKLSDSLSQNGMLEAIRLAQAVAGGDENTRILLFTDHKSLIDLFCEKLKSRVLLFDTAEPVENLALLGAQIIPAGKNQIRLEVSAGFWGKNAVESVIELRDKDILLQKQNISLQPDTIKHCIFDVNQTNIERLSVEAVCGDSFKDDNHLAISGCVNGFKVYIAEDVPEPLKLCLNAEGSYRQVGSPADADLVIVKASPQTNITKPGIYLVNSGQNINSAEKIIPTENLYPDENKRNSISADLFVAGGNALAGLSEKALPLLTTEDGKILAAMEYRGSARAVFVAAGLFGDQSTFWKQPQFPEIFLRITEIAASSADNTKDMRIRPEYANLWFSQAAEKSAVPVNADDPVSFYQGVLLAAALLLVVQIYGYYRGVIV